MFLLICKLYICIQNVFGHIFYSSRLHLYWQFWQFEVQKLAYMLILAAGGSSPYLSSVEGGGRTPNGKCHLKFPFWLSAPFPYLASCVCVPAHTFTFPPILFALFCANSFSIRPPFSLKANVWLGALIYAKLPQLPEPDHFWSMWFAIAFFLYLHRISFGICVAYLCVPTALV